jgi:hypothetical protein
VKKPRPAAQGTRAARASGKPCRNTGAEDAKAQQRKRGKHERHRILERRLVTAETLCELAE